MKHPDPDSPDQIRFTTGRSLYTNATIIGLGSDCLYPMEGYDGNLEQAAITRPKWMKTDDQWHPLSTAEKLELADEMIRRWTVYRHAVLATYPPTSATPR